MQPWREEAGEGAGRALPRSAQQQAPLVRTERRCVRGMRQGANVMSTLRMRTAPRQRDMRTSMGFLSIAARAVPIWHLPSTWLPAWPLP